MAIATTESAPQKRNQGDLYKAFKPLFCFGRLVGFVPICGLFRTSGDLSGVRCGSGWSPIRIFSIVVTISLTLYMTFFFIGFLITGARDAKGIAKSVSSFVFAFIGLYVCIFMQRNSNKLIQCFHHWRNLSTTFYREDIHLSSSINVISCIIIVSGILENASSHWKVMAVPRNSNVTLPWNQNRTYLASSTLEIYWWDHHYGRFKNIIQFNVPLAVALFIWNKWCVYAWNFGDSLIACMARAIYKRFQLHYEAAKEALEQSIIPNSEGAFQKTYSRNFLLWNDLVDDHEKLTDLLNNFNEILSPLIFWSCAANVYFLGITLYNFFESTGSSLTSPTNSGDGDGHIFYDSIDLSNYFLWHQVYVTWAFLHLLGRTFVTLVCCARVNDYAHKTVRLLDKCPPEIWNGQVERMDVKLRTTKIGLTGLNFFTISKPFLLKIVNVIVTFEIVLLQSTSTKK